MSNIESGIEFARILRHVGREVEDIARHFEVQGKKPNGATIYCFTRLQLFLGMLWSQIGKTPYVHEEDLYHKFLGIGG